MSDIGDIVISRIPFDGDRFKTAKDILLPEQLPEICTNCPIVLFSNTIALIRIFAIVSKVGF